MRGRPGWPTRGSQPLPWQRGPLPPNGAWSPRRWRRPLPDRSGCAALLVLVAVVLAAVAAPLLAPHDPIRQELPQAFSSPSREHLLGADHLGRDVLSRLLYGARTTLGSAVAVLSGVLLIGAGVGLIAGFCAGWVDALLMRLTGLLLALPTSLLAIAVAGTFGQSLLHVALALTLVGWPGFARTVRGLVLVCREQQYVLAARMLGASRRRIIIKDILPNIVGPVIVLASLELGSIILALAGLNFLGFGVQPPTAEWGAMLRAAQPHLQTHPQLLLYPSAAVVVVVLAVNVLADRLRDAFDPSHRS